MLYKIALICDEVADFFREITIDADAKFLDLSNAILAACGYDDSQITSFFTCSDTWDKELQIVREDMGTSAEDEDVYLMASTPLRDLLEDEEQKMIYVFDPANDRIFYLELTEIVTGKSLDKAECTMSRGKAPQQLKGFDHEGKHDLQQEDQADTAKQADKRQPLSARQDLARDRRSLKQRAPLRLSRKV